ncbi:MAG: dihydrofolate reductase family protein, partial [Bacteroidota bacterium]
DLVSIFTCNVAVSWMHTKGEYTPGITLSDADIADFLDSVDCYVMGAHTYESALDLGWPYGNKPVYVLTNRGLPNKRSTVSFHSGDLSTWTNNYLRRRHKNSWMVGGAALTAEFIRLKLADELVISMLPIILGSGIPFFYPQQKSHLLALLDVKAYSDGMVEMRYGFKR